MAGLFLWKNEMPQYFSPVGNSQITDANGDPLVGGQIETYLSGSSTPAATYTDDTGLTQQTNPIILNSLGWPTLGAVWLTGGKSYKFIIKSAAGVTLRTIDDIAGINDASVSQSEWIESGFTPTYINATSFSVPGDQTATLQINRRVRTQNTSGFIYSTISNSVFAAGITTVTLVNDSGTLDAGLSAVAYGLLSAQNDSVPSTFAKLASPTFTGDPKAPTPANGDNDTSIATTAFVRLAPVRGSIDGLILSTAGSSTTMSVAAGEAADSTSVVRMTLAASLSKTTSAWTVGTAAGGKLSAAAIANNTWYYWYLIRRPDTGVVDVGFDVSATAPTLPANYTQYRYIGATLTNSSAQWVRFFQDGDTFLWDAPVADVSAASAGTSAVTRTLTTPRRVTSALLIVNATVGGAVPSETLLISPLYMTDAAPANTASPGATLSVPNSQTLTTQIQVDTNTSAQVRSRQTDGSANSTLRIITRGWIDSRGRDA